MVAAATLPRRARLLKPQQFKRVFATGRRFVRSPLALALLASTEGYARVGLAIGRKHAPQAVERNRVKRLVRESFRQRRAQLPVIDIVIYPVARLADVPSREIRHSLEQLWSCLQNASPPR